MEDLDAASLEDVHGWFKQYYGAANTVLVLAGDLDAAAGKRLAEKYFGHIPPGPPLQRNKSWVPDRRSNSHEQMYDRVPQVRSFQNWSVPGRTTRERALLELAALVLGDGKNSRLYQALIYQTQYAVSLEVAVEPHELASVFSIDTTLAPNASLDEVNEIIAYELNVFLQKGPREEELERARSKINASIIRGLEAVGGFSGKAATLAQGELYDGNPVFFKTMLQWLNEASAEEVRQAAVDWLSDGRYQLDVLPYPEFTAALPKVDRSKGLPVVTGLPRFDFPLPQRAQLKNGIEVVLSSRHDLPTVDLAIQFDAGFAADQGLALGTASFTLDMLDESTRNRSALEISAESERLGAEISSSSNLDTSIIYLAALKPQLARSLELFADVVRNPAFSNEEMERMRVRKLAGLEQEKSQPIGVALRTLPPLIYGTDHPYGIPFTGSGTEASINSIQREDLEQFHQNWLRPDNATIFVIGATEMGEILPLLEGAFGDWTVSGGAANVGPPAKQINEVALAGQTRVFLVDKPDSPQSLILAAHLAPPTGAENNIAIEVMNDVLGGTYSARVNQTLRVQKQWSYGAFTFLADARGQRPWIVYAPVQTDKTADAVQELVILLQQFQDQEPATQDELTRVIRNSIYSLPGQFETQSAVLNAMLSNQRFSRPDDYLNRLPGKFESVGLEQIQATSNEVLHPASLTWVIVGDAAKIRKSLEALELAPVQAMDSDGNILP
jgi:zinc protease